MGLENMTSLSQGSSGNSLKTHGELRSTPSHLSLGPGTSEDLKLYRGLNHSNQGCPDMIQQYREYF